MRILRHEAGHAIDNAYRLRRRRRWRELFGKSSQPYPDYYSPKPYSKRYVLHLDAWYAQSHPVEDFAEIMENVLKNGKALGELHGITKEEMEAEATTIVEEDLKEAKEDSMEEDMEDRPTEEEVMVDNNESEESVSIAALVDTRKQIVERRKRKKREQTRQLKERLPSWPIPQKKWKTGMAQEPIGEQSQKG